MHRRSADRCARSARPLDQRLARRLCVEKWSPLVQIKLLLYFCGLLHRAVAAAELDLGPGGTRVRLRHRHPRHLALRLVAQPLDPRQDLRACRLSAHPRARGRQSGTPAGGRDHIHIHDDDVPRAPRDRRSGDRARSARDPRRPAVPATIWLGSSEREDEEDADPPSSSSSAAISISRCGSSARTSPASASPSRCMLRAMSRAGLGARRHRRLHGRRLRARTTAR